MTVTDDELDGTLRAWGAAYRDTGTATAEPVRITDASELRRRRPIWPMLAAAAIVLAVAAGVVLAHHADRTTAPSFAGSCGGRFVVNEVSEEQSLPPDLGIVLGYEGREPCRIALQAPAVVLVGADGHRYGTGTPTGSSAGSAVVHPAATVSFAIERFLNCRGVPTQKYSLEVTFGAGGRVNVPIGVREGSPNLCLVSGRAIGAISRLTVSPPQTGSVTGRLVFVGGPVQQKPIGIAGTVTFTGPMTRTLRTQHDGRFELSLPIGRYRVGGHSPQFIVNGVQSSCAGHDVLIAADDAVNARVVCAGK